MPASTPAEYVQPRRRSPVGVPVQEQRLTEATVATAGDLLPGYGSLVVVREAAVGIGKPDLILMRVDLERLALRRSAGLRLRNYQEAVALRAFREDRADDLALTKGYVRRLKRTLVDRGWFELADRDTVILHSLVIEAKLNDWRRAVGQLAQVRWAASLAALVVPHRLAPRIPSSVLERRGMGIITVDDLGSTVWSRPSEPDVLPFELDGWLAELAIREIESSTSPRP